LEAAEGLESLSNQELAAGGGRANSALDATIVQVGGLGVGCRSLGRMCSCASSLG
jgi:hypothetical protein